MSEELKRKLKAAREKLGLSQSQAAKKWGIPVKTLQAWEHNRQTPRGFALAHLNSLLDGLLAAPPTSSTPKGARSPD